MPALDDLLARRGVLLADGATGTNLFDAGLMSGDAPELWNMEEEEKVRALHRGFVEAGADIILTNTFGANAMRLKLHGAQTRVREINRRAAELAREVAEESGREIVVAGSVGPTGELFAPLGELTPETATAAFIDQMEGLKAGGADVAWIETMSAREEIDAASAAAREVGLPYVFTASFDTAGMTMMGVPPASMNVLAATMDPPPLAVGANCGVGASDLLAAVLQMTEGRADGAPVAIVAKANCGIPQVKGDAVVYSGTPALMADYVRLAVDAGASIIGGCCGTSAEHLAAMREALDEHVRGERPDFHRIRQTTGAFVNSVGAVDEAGRTRRPGGRSGGRPGGRSGGRRRSG